MVNGFLFLAIQYETSYDASKYFFINGYKFFKEIFKILAAFQNILLVCWLTKYALIQDVFSILKGSYSP